MDYKASMDTTAKLLTAGCFILFAFIFYRALLAIYSNGASRSIFYYYGVAGLLVAILIGSFATSVSKYRVTDASLIIMMPAYNKVINKTDIASAEIVDKDHLGLLLRTFGNGGLFGYYGWFRSPAEGSIFFYASQRNNRILIKLKNGEKYIITPDDLTILSSLQL